MYLIPCIDFLVNTTGAFKMSEIYEKFKKELAELRAEYLAYYANISKELDDGIHDTDRQTEDTEDKEN